MTAEKRHRYQRYRPEIYMPGISIFWWMKRKPYVLFILRELTSIVVAVYVLFTLYMVYTLNQGEPAWQSLLACLETPLSITLHVVALAALLFHSFTWFWIAPTAVVLRIGGRRVPDGVIIGMNLMMWAVLSLAIGWFLLSA